MGLFSSKTSYKVNVTVADVFEDGAIPDSARNGITKAIMGGTDVQGQIMEELSNSIGVRASCGYTWAAKPGNYPLGIPKSDIKSYIDAESVVKQAIQANIGRTVTLEYYRMAPLNAMHFGWQHCFTALLYNPATNELVKLTQQTANKKCYLVNMVVTVRKVHYDWMVETSDLGCLDQLGPSPKSGYLPSAPFNSLPYVGSYAEQPDYEVSSVATEDYVTITYEYEDSPGVFVRRGVTVTMAGYSDDADYHMARYKDSTGKVGFFTYMHGAGTYPLVDIVFQATDLGIGTYYPWVYYRIGRQTAQSALTNDEYQAMVRWCHYIGVDYDTMNDAVVKDVEKDDVSQVMMCFGVNPGGEEQSELEYLFKHFDRLHANAKPQPGLVPDLYGKMNAFTSSPSQFQRIKDKQFAISYQFSGIVKVRRTGVVTGVNQYKGALKDVPQNAQTFATQGPNGVGTGTNVPTQKAYVYQHQVNESVYDEIAVYNLRMNYEVHTKKGFAAGPGDDTMLIPADRAIVETIGLDKREDLLCRSLKLMVNTVVKIKQPWYASGAFRVLMMIVAVVITIVSLGAAWQSIVAAAALGVGALALTVLTIIVTGLVIKVGVQLFVKIVGPELGMVAAVLAVAAGAYGIAANANWGETLISVATNLADTSAETMQAMFTGVIDELTQFQQMSAGLYDSLTEQKDLLGLNSNMAGLIPDDFINKQPMIILGETPNDLYTRTVHSGNIGATGFLATQYYHDTALTLPRINDTLSLQERDNGLAIF